MQPPQSSHPRAWAAIHRHCRLCLCWQHWGGGCGRTQGAFRFAQGAGARERIVAGYTGLLHDDRGCRAQGAFHVAKGASADHDSARASAMCTLGKAMPASSVAAVFRNPATQYRRGAHNNPDMGNACVSGHCELDGHVYANRGDDPCSHNNRRRNCNCWAHHVCRAGV